MVSKLSMFHFLYEVISSQLFGYNILMLGFILRFLDTAGLKKSSAYLVNGILMFVAWLVSEISYMLY